jgi:hypothetical protein
MPSIRSLFEFTEFTESTELLKHVVLAAAAAAKLG